MSLDAKLATALAGVSTATLTTVLLKQGLRNVWMRGTRPLRADQPRLVGRAFTLRFVPAREDLATPASWSLAEIDPLGDRGHARRAHRRGGCARRHRCRHLRRHPVRAHGQARGCRARHRRRRARPRGRAGHRRCPCGARGRRRRLRLPASRSSIGSSRSAAAALPCSPTTWWSPMPMAPSSFRPPWSRASPRPPSSRRGWKGGSCGRSRAARRCRGSIRPTTRTRRATRPPSARAKGPWPPCSSSATGAIRPRSASAPGASRSSARRSKAAGMTRPLLVTDPRLAAHADGQGCARRAGRATAWRQRSSATSSPTRSRPTSRPAWRR